MSGSITAGAATGVAAGVVAGMSDGFTKGPLLPQPPSVKQKTDDATSRAMLFMGKFMGQV